MLPSTAFPFPAQMLYNAKHLKIFVQIKNIMSDFIDSKTVKMERMTGSETNGGTNTTAR